MSVHWPDTRVKPGYWLGAADGLQPLPDLKGDVGISGYPRDWTVTIPQASPAEVAALYAMAAHDVTFTTDLAGTRRARVGPTSPANVGPFHWVTPYSRMMNLLPPRATSGPHGWAGVARSQGGPVALEDGMAASSVQVSATSAASAEYSPLIPVVPGMPVVASAYPRKATGWAGVFRLDWMALGAAQNGAALATAGSAAVVSTAAPLARLSIAATPPSNVHLARLTFLGVPQIAMPALTWSKTLQDRSAGQGCSGVVVHALTSSPRMAREGVTREEVSFTVSEVG